MSEPMPEPVYNGGPWGPAMDVILSLFPIAILLYTTLKSNPLPTTQSLPLAALLIWFVRIAYLQSDPLETCALAILGFFSAITPITIVAGAIYLFEAMESTRCLDWMRARMKELSSGHPVAEVMLIGWAFAYMIEGASGFGTPAALASPMLMGMGHPKLETVVCLLLMNTFATVFGAVGTPIWFGLGGTLRKDEARLKAVGIRAALVTCIASFLLVPLVVSILVPRKVVRKNLIFVMLSIASIAIPSVAIASFSYDFPSLVGGSLGLVITAGLIKYKVGLRPAEISPDDGLDPAVEPPGVTSVEEEEDVEAAAEAERGAGAGAGAGAANPHPSMEQLDGSGAGSSSRGGAKKANDLELENMSAHARVKHPSAAAVSELPARADTDAEDHEDASPPELAWQTSASKRAGAGNRAPDVKYVDLRQAESQSSMKRKGSITDPLAIAVKAEKSAVHALGRMMPLWLTVLLLMLTRIEEIGIKGVFKDQSNLSINWDLGNLGRFWLSYSGVVGLSHILRAGDPNPPEGAFGHTVNWSYEILYVPFVIPFVIAGTAALLLYRDQLKTPPKQIVLTVVGRMVKPSISLFGALALVQMMRGTRGDLGTPAYLVGVILSDALSYGWLVLAAPLGILGSFFSGSTTVSNLTFGDVQKVAAQQLGLHVESLLALQTCGATMGNAGAARRRRRALRSRGVRGAARRAAAARSPRAPHARSRPAPPPRDPRPAPAPPPSTRSSLPQQHHCRVRGRRAERARRRADEAHRPDCRPLLRDRHARPHPLPLRQQHCVDIGCIGEARCTH